MAVAEAVVAIASDHLVCNTSERVSASGLTGGVRCALGVAPFAMPVVCTPIVRHGPKMWHVPRLHEEKHIEEELLHGGRVVIPHPLDVSPPRWLVRGAVTG